MDSTRTSVSRGHVAAVEQLESATRAAAPATDNGATTTAAGAEAAEISAQKLSARDVSWLYRAVVAGLVGTMAIAMFALTWTTIDGKTSPDLMLTVFTGALGGLVGLFARSPN